MCGAGGSALPAPGRQKMLWVVKIQMCAVPVPCVGRVPFVFSAERRQTISPSGSRQTSGGYDGEGKKPLHPNPQSLAPFSGSVRWHCPYFVNGRSSLCKPRSVVVVVCPVSSSLCTPPCGVSPLRLGGFCVGRRVPAEWLAGWFATRLGACRWKLTGSWT